MKNPDYHQFGVDRAAAEMLFRSVASSERFSLRATQGGRELYNEDAALGENVWSVLDRRSPDRILNNELRISEAKDHGNYRVVYKENWGLKPVSFTTEDPRQGDVFVEAEALVDCEEVGGYADWIKAHGANVSYRGFGAEEFLETAVDEDLVRPARLGEDRVEADDLFEYAENRLNWDLEEEVYGWSKRGSNGLAVPGYFFSQNYFSEPLSLLPDVEIGSG